jgi:hypothetical protein
MAKKSNYSKSTPLPGLIHDGGNAPLKGKDSPFKMIVESGSTMMNTTNAPLATQPLMKKKKK